LLCIEFPWNQFKCETLDNSNYDNSHGGGDFSHVYVLMYQYFCEKSKMQKMNTYVFYRQFDMFSYMMIIFWISCDLHLRPQILTIMNTNNQPNGQKQ
jgi:hypothetical protein